MRPAAARGGILLALVLALAACSDAADTARTAPSRPGGSGGSSLAWPTRRLGGVDCVNLPSAAARLGLRTIGQAGGRRLLIAGHGTRAEIEGDTRDISVNGLRVFLGQPVQVYGGDLYVSRTDFERCLAPLLRPGLGMPPLAPPRVVAIDAGHGGRDWGKVNEQLKVNEKTLALDTARRLKQLLEADGYRVVLTRDADRYLELAERPAIANRAHADVFVSLHFNALEKDRKTSGVEVYTFAPQHQRSTESWMPGKKDDSQATAEPANAFDYWNSLLAQSLHRTLVRDLKASDRGKKLMHLGVLRSLHCPGVLLECGFLSSDVEARKISTAAYRQQIAGALRDGIRDYAEEIVRLRPKSGAAATSPVTPSSPSS